jgi:hypothetical protein
LTAKKTQQPHQYFYVFDIAMDPIGVLKRSASFGGRRIHDPQPHPRQIIRGLASTTSDRRAVLARAAALAALAALAIFGPSFPVISRYSSLEDKESLPAAAARTLVIIGAASSSSYHNVDWDEDEAALKQRLALEREGSSSSHPQRSLRTVFLDHRQQRELVLNQRCGIRKYDELLATGQRQLAAEMFKYCGLLSVSSSLSHGFQSDALFVDLDSPLLFRIEDLLRLLPAEHSLAVLGDPVNLPKTIQSGPILLLRHRHIALVAREMLRLIVETPLDKLALEALLIQRSLYRIIESIAAEKQSQQHPAAISGPLELHPGSNGGEFYLMELSCRMAPLRRITVGTGNRDGSQRTSVSTPEKDDDNVGLFSCQRRHEYCCSLLHRPAKQIVMVSRQPAVPNFYVPNAGSASRLPYNAEEGLFQEEEMPFVSTVRETVVERPPDQLKETPNLYEILYAANKLPRSKCIKCLHLRKCERYEHYCEQYLQDVCQTPYPSKFVSKQVTVSPPLYRRDPSRLIPRIVHQTWFEDLDPDRYPNMSRLVESWKRSGWEYKFYSDDDAETFLRTHFPVEVLQAYRSLIPGAFKADLFRYCALLIHGGVYADVDILLESSLDVVVEPDVGFMVPMDEPEGCVWQGLIAAAPGHPFMAHAIQTVVNQVRNRFTSVDIDATFCPNPRYKVLHSFDVLFTAGPCLLGSSMNRVLGRHGQELFEPGDLLPQWVAGSDENTTAVETPALWNPLNVSHVPVPGRTVILKQNKEDMGAHRFTYVSRNLVVAATDLENSDDRKNWPKEPRYAEPLAHKTLKEGKDAAVQETAGGEHYSKAHARTGIYGIEGLYVDHELVDEDIRIAVVDERQDWNHYAMRQIENAPNSQATVGTDAH